MLLNLSPAAPMYGVVKSAVKPRRNNNNNRRASQAMVSLPPSMCLNKFISAAFRPFSEEAKGSCVPFGTVASSARYSFRGQITVVIGTTGVGFINFMPTLASNQAVAFYSTQGFARSDCAITNGAPAIYNGATKAQVSGFADPNIGIAVIDSGISSTTLTNGLSVGDDSPQFAYRLVGGGLVTHYIGTELNRSGMIYSYQSSIHASSGSYGVGGPTALNEAGLSGIQETFMCPMTRVKTTFPFLPISQSEMLYSNELPITGAATDPTHICYPLSNGEYIQPSANATAHAARETTTSVYAATPTITQLFTGYPGEKVLVEYIMHFEATGPLTNGMSKQQADADPVGAQRVQAAFQRFNSNRVRKPGVDSYSEFKKFYDEVSNATMPARW